MGLSDMQGALLTFTIMPFIFGFYAIIDYGQQHHWNIVLTVILAFVILFAFAYPVMLLLTKFFHAYNKKHPWIWYIKKVDGTLEEMKPDISIKAAMVDLDEEERLELDMVNQDDVEG